MRRALGLLAAVGLTTVVVGCGGSDDPQPPAASAVPIDRDVQRFRALANDVCATIHGRRLPPPAASSGAAQTKRYAQASARTNRALAQSMRRLPTPDVLKDEVDALAGAYREAQRAYAAMARDAASGAVRDAARTAAQERERAISARATAAGLPACA